METPAATPPAPAAAPYKRGRLDLKDLPPGRFLYTINGTGAILEGRILDRCDDDPDTEGEWLKLDESGEWRWSPDVWIECRLPELPGAEKTETLAEMPVSEFDKLLSRTAQLVATAILGTAQTQPPAPAPAETAKPAAVKKK